MKYVIALLCALGGAFGYTPSRAATMVTGTYTAQAADCGSVLALGGNAFYALTIDAASSYSTDCALTVVNTDGSRGKAMTIDGIAQFILWPGQTIQIRSVGTSWAPFPSFQRWKAPLGTVLYVDHDNGSDGNDCLAPGAGACATIQRAAMYYAHDFMTVSAGSQTPDPAGIIVQIAPDPSCNVSTGAGCYDGAHIAGPLVGGEGRNAMMIQGAPDATSPPIIVGNANGSAIGAFDGAHIEIRNLELVSLPGHDLECSGAAEIRLEGDVILGAVSSSNAQLYANDHCTIAHDAGTVAVTGGGANLALAQDAEIDLDWQTVTFGQNVSYSQQTLSASGLGYVNIYQTTWNLGGHSVSGTRYWCGTNGVIDSGSGNPNGAIPGSSNGSGTTGCQAN